MDYQLALVESGGGSGLEFKDATSEMRWMSVLRLAPQAGVVAA